MPSDSISFRDTNYFSSLICDYLDETPELRPLYNRFPSLENFEDQIKEKLLNFNHAHRSVLQKVITDQYALIDVSLSTLTNIASLKDNHTFTITTGHQLNLFTGPLYFLYKIISVINLTKQLKEKHPEYNFVPIYWMATEDHDFDEINYFNFKGKKVQWSRDASGGVGRLDTDGLDVVCEAFSMQIGTGINDEELKTLFKNAYSKHDTLTEATRFLANALFGEYGLVIIDADDSNLKRLFIPYIQKELLEQSSFQNVLETNKMINGFGYKTQVSPREINLFYLTEELRERIVYNGEEYKVLNAEITWTESELLNEVNDHPEKFSPNVIMRPLYQEVILPNLCYIGGGGELAYWLQLKEYFKSVTITFPMLLLRNSVLIKTEKQSDKLKKLGLTVNDLFMDQLALMNDQTKKLSEIEIDLTPQKEHLQNQFKALYKIAKQTDKSFLGAVAAQEKKQIKGLIHLEKRLLKAQKRKLQTHLDRIKVLQDELFPGQSLQERNMNFSELYLEYGKELIPHLIHNLEPLKSEFLIING
jgi:bacillithiol biosynthesis cysteine-adding enzyme BshC